MLRTLQPKSKSRPGPELVPAGSADIASIGQTPRSRPETILGLGAPRDPGLEMWSQIVTVTPEQARDLLTRLTPGQRPVRPGTVRKLAYAISNDRWELTHQGLAFDVTGHLLDGQHRLHACIAAGVPIRVLIVFNLPVDTFKVVDRGLHRSAADDLMTMGAVGHLHQGNMLAAAARLVWFYDQGKAPTTNWGNEVGGTPATDDLLDTIKRHPLLAETVDWCSLRRTRWAIRMPTGPMAAMLTLCREVDDTLAMMFAEQVVSGESIQKGDPAYQLREAQLNKTGNNKEGRNAFMWRFVRAWNALREGRTLRVLYGTDFRHVGFPAIHGRNDGPAAARAKAEREAARAAAASVKAV